MSNPAPILIAIIGSGLIGLRHIDHCVAEPEVALACIVEPGPAGAPLAAKHGVPLFASVGDMLAARAKGEVEVAGAIVATPNHTHVPLGRELVEAGVHALVEKPISTDVASGRELLAAVGEGKGKVLVGHHRRFNPYIVNTKTLLDRDAVGKVVAVQGIWSCLKPAAYFEPPTAWRAEAAAGGPILINLVHDVDLLRHLFGDITRVYCEQGPNTRGHAVEETGACTLRFASGAVGTFIFSDAAASPFQFEGATGENPTMPHTGEPVYTILGTQGSVSFPSLKVFRYPDPATGSWTSPLVQDDALPIDNTPPFTRQLQHFARVCRGEEEPGCSALEALKAIATLEAIKESIRTGLPVVVPQE